MPAVLWQAGQAVQSEFSGNGGHGPARVPLIGLPHPRGGETKLRGESLYFFILVVLGLNTHFQSWIESYLLPTFFCQVASLLPPRRAFSLYLAHYRSFLRVQAPELWQAFLKGSTALLPPFIFSGFFLMEIPKLPHLSLSSLEIESLEKGNGFGPRLASPLKDRHAFAKEKLKNKCLTHAPGIAGTCQTHLHDF